MRFVGDAMLFMMYLIAVNAISRWNEALIFCDMRTRPFIRDASYVQAAEQNCLIKISSSMKEEDIVLRASIGSQ